MCLTVTLATRRCVSRTRQAPLACCLPPFFVRLLVSLTPTCVCPQSDEEEEDEDQDDRPRRVCLCGVGESFRS